MTGPRLRCSTVQDEERDNPTSLAAVSLDKVHVKTLSYCTLVYILSPTHFHFSTHGRRTDQRASHPTPPQI